MRRTGHADLPLHGGTVPRWLADRMKTLGTLIMESLVMNFGKNEVLLRLSDPFWFQSFGAVLGMDWHSSGITTSVMYALKRGLNPRAKELGICVCGGRGTYSRNTPDELRFLSEATGLDGDSLIKSSRLCAKVDNTAVQDGFQLYQHNFVLTNSGDWCVVQQGMNTQSKTARRYHWCSLNFDRQKTDSYLNSPHTAIIGENKGEILNLADTKAHDTRSRILELSKDEPGKLLSEFSKISEYRQIVMPAHEDVRPEDVNLKRLGAVLVTSYESNPHDFESLLLTPGLGPRTLQSLTLVSEVIYGTPSRFSDPARFSFAHGGKDGHPFPVPVKIYDETIRVMQESIEKAKLNYTDKSYCLRRLHKTAEEIENAFLPKADFYKTIEHEKAHSAEWDGRTVYK